MSLDFTSSVEEGGGKHHITQFHSAWEHQIGWGPQMSILTMRDYADLCAGHRFSMARGFTLAQSM